MDIKLIYEPLFFCSWDAYKSNNGRIHLSSKAFQFSAPVEDSGIHRVQDLISDFDDRRLAGLVVDGDVERGTLLADVVEGNQREDVVEAALVDVLEPHGVLQLALVLKLVRTVPGEALGPDGNRNKTQAR